MEIACLITAGAKVTKKKVAEVSTDGVEAVVAAVAVAVWVLDAVSWE